MSKYGVRFFLYAVVITVGLAVTIQVYRDKIISGSIISSSEGLEGSYIVRLSVTNSSDFCLYELTERTSRSFVFEVPVLFWDENLTISVYDTICTSLLYNETIFISDELRSIIELNPILVDFENAKHKCSMERGQNFPYFHLQFNESMTIVFIFLLFITILLCLLLIYQYNSSQLFSKRKVHQEHSTSTLSSVDNTTTTNNESIPVVTPSSSSSSKSRRRSVHNQHHNQSQCQHQCQQQGQRQIIIPKDNEQSKLIITRDNGQEQIHEPIQLPRQSNGIPQNNDLLEQLLRENSFLPVKTLLTKRTRIAVTTTSSSRTTTTASSASTNITAATAINKTNSDMRANINTTTTTTTNNDNSNSNNTISYDITSSPNPPARNRKRKTMSRI